MTPSLCPAHCGTRLVDGACPLCDAPPTTARPLCINGCGYQVVDCNCLACVTQWRDPGERGCVCVYCDHGPRSWFVAEATAALTSLLAAAGGEVGDG